MVRFFSSFSLILFTILTSQPVYSAEECISKKDLTEIAENFVQFQPYLNEAEEYCVEQLTPDWLKVLQSLVALKNSAALEPDHDPEDALTFKAITENDWWAYFVTRANKITIPPNCPEGAAAYVMPMFEIGNVNLCRPFFEASRFSQASIMMHEVRHFDGHSHVTCTRGMDKGNRGGCDPEIGQKGSYAITVQTLVALARSQEIEEADKLLLESEAIFTAFNRFNKVPDVRMKEMMILSSTTGEVFEWELGVGIKSLAKLNEPAVVLNSYDNLTIYPLDTAIPAYRTNRNAVTPIASIGLFANSYNAETQEEKSKYKNISYLGVGGLLKENTLITVCGNATALFNQDLSTEGEFNSLISLSVDQSDSDRATTLVRNDGKLFTVECDPVVNNKVNLKEETISLSSELAEQLVESYGLGGEQYGVLADGRFVKLVLNNNTFEISPLEIPIQDQQWVSATPMSIPELFNP